MREQIFDYQTRSSIDRPEKLKAFLKEIDEVCQKYGFSIAHEDEYGGFIIDEYKQENIEWLYDAAKRFSNKE